MSIKNSVPNTITIFNMISGSLSVIFAFSGNLYLAGWFILLAAVFDLADGLMARLLNANTRIGVVLDSLADVISFGMAPAMIVFQLLRVGQHDSAIALYGVPVLPFLGLLLLIAAALRLAIFTVDDTQRSTFRGMPTPAAAIFFAAFPMIQSPDRVFHFVHNTWFIMASVILISLLMLSRLPMISMKFKDLSWRQNASRYILTGISLILIILLRATAIPLIIVAYVLISVFTGEPDNIKNQNN